MAQKILLVGGSGFVGQNLSKHFMAEHRHQVGVFDFQLPKIGLGKEVFYHHGSILSLTDLMQCFTEFKPTIVVHLASCGMSGSSMLDESSSNININGTENVIRACKSMNVRFLIYTSTYNVVYGGLPIFNGNEDMPIFPVEKHSDRYGPSKAISESMILKSNGETLSGGGTLLTCSLRPAAIYGEDEQRHLPRIIKHIDSGLFFVRIGRAIVDWLHINNLVQAFHKAVECMVESEITGTRCVLAGQCYFISDGTPIDNFLFLRPLCEARLCAFPSLTVPTSFILIVAYLSEKLYFLSKNLGWPIEPLLTRAEVYKVGVTHTFSIEKATRHFGYAPTLTSTEGARRIGAYYSLGNDPYFYPNYLRLFYYCKY